MEKREILSHQKKKNFVKSTLVTYLVKPLLSRNFCKNAWERIPIISTLCCRKFNTCKIFREINCLVIYLVKPLLSRNFCQKCVRENSRTLHNFQFQFSLKFREINLYCNADFTNIFTFGGKFRNFQMLLLLSHFAHLQSNSWNQFFVRFIIKSSDETLNSTTFTQLDLKCYKYVIDL